MTASKTAVQATPKAAPAAASPAVKAATYPDTHVITAIKPNPKRGAAAKRYALYTEGMTVAAYLEAAAALHPDEPKYRWRADLNWDTDPKRGYIVVSAPATK